MIFFIMIKRFFSAFFILSANIILLAYTVIPHHHHDGVICVASSHCQPGDEVNYHKTDGNNHEHDGGGDFGYCILQQVIVIPSDQPKPECKCLNSFNNHSHINGFQAVLIDNRQYFPLPAISSTAEHILLSSAYSDFAGTGLGLRAPPVV